jgi:acyl-CoA-binding protein
METDLDTKFKEAFEIASKIEHQLPPDVMLRIYAYFKQATTGMHTLIREQNNIDLRNAFKTNAWMQISHLSVTEAKEMYIALIDEIVANKNT